MPISTDRDKIKTYIISILTPLVLGGAVGLLTSGSMRYDSLTKPPLSPPALLFPIAWTILYTLMGVSHGILKANRLSDDNTELIYYAQLIVNLIWPVLFFAFEWRLAAFVWILLLDALVITMTVRFYRINRAAGLLQIPYVLWVLFATYLNLAVWMLNR